MIDQSSNFDLWKRLKEVWESERRPEFIILGTAQYRVFTPRGEEDPVFSGMTDVMMYGMTSTGIVGNEKRPVPPTATPTPPAQPTPATPKRGRGKNA